jgi:hypothetical protein
MKKIIYTTYLIFFSLVAFAQTEKIETDRPGKTISPGTAGQKMIQFETGFSIETEKVTAPKKDLYVQHPYLLTKYGLGKRIEIRLITELATIKEINVNGNTIRTGLNSVQLGGKLNFLKGKGLSPKVSLIAHYDFRRFRTMYKGGDSIDGANFRFAFQHTFSETIFLSYNLGMEWKRFNSRNPTYLYSFSPRFNITEKWFAFIEVFGFIWKNYSPENSIDFGAAYNISDNFKIDASAGFGLNKKAPDSFYSIGASFRFKTSKSD